MVYILSQNENNFINTLLKEGSGGPKIKGSDRIRILIPNLFLTSFQGEFKHSEEPRAPPKLIWLVMSVWTVLILLSFIRTITIEAVFFNELQAVFIQLITLLYISNFGIFYGSLTQAFVAECRAVTAGDETWEKATLLLANYRGLKQGSRLGLFVIPSACTIIVLINMYMLFVMVAYSCLNLGHDLTVYPSMILQMSGFTLYLFYVTTCSDSCFESLQEMADEVRQV